MIKVQVPAGTGTAERGERASDWVDVPPYVLSNYKIYPLGRTPINLDCGVVVQRGRTYPDDPIQDEDEVLVDISGRLQVFANGQDVEKMHVWTEPENGVWIADTGHQGRRVHVRMDYGAQCNLEVRNGGRTLARARLIHTKDPGERDQILKEENRVDGAWLSQYSGGTSDFG